MSEPARSDSVQHSAPPSSSSAASASTSSSLVPSQAISSSKSRNHRRNRKPRGKKPANSNAQADPTSGTSNSNANSDPCAISNENDGKPGKTNGNNTRRRPRNRDKNKKKIKQVGANATGEDGNAPAPTKMDPGDNNQEQNQVNGNKNKNKKRGGNNNKRKNRKKKGAAWRKEIPPNTVDPISLEPLDTLPYPPFALTITPPYVPIPVWPVPKNEEDNNGKKDDLGTEIATREERMLSEQWSDLLPKDEDDDGKHDTNVDGNVHANGSDESAIQTSKTGEETHYHLFDGRVLAVYLVSTLQFIDPLNRRDLTREEIQNIDHYLSRHSLKKMNVLSAYDEKGVSLSSAGVMGQSQGGRLRIRQEEARNLLNSLFGSQGFDNGGGRSGDGVQEEQQSQRNRRRRRNRNRNENENGYANANANVSPDIHGSDGNVHGNEMMQYNYQGSQRPQPQPQSNHNYEQPYDFWNADQQYDSWNADSGIYGTGDSGMLIIDDDFNPGLRAGLNNPIQTNLGGGTSGSNGGVPLPDTSQTSGGQWSNMSRQYGHAARVQADNFPALPTATATSSAATSETNSEKNGGKTSQKKVQISSSLSKIGTFVQKTKARELEKQRRARMLALRKAEIANMSYEEGVKRLAIGEDQYQRNIGAGAGSNIGLLTPLAPTTQTEPTVGQLERNRNLASALGVAPATLRQKHSSGWARPTVTPTELDEFGNELNKAQYPDALIIEARERMTELVRLEKKWLTFLKDDKAASCPLKPMDRPMRKFVHGYSDFWHLHTQSFDPQPQRYIHCVKLLDTSAPCPLLSEAVRTWKGPTKPPPKINVAEHLPNQVNSTSDDLHSEHEQPAGEETMSSTREFINTEERQPLKLAARSIGAFIEAPPGAMFDMLDVPSNEPMALKGPASASREAAPRFAPMLAERERPRIKLDPRTKPLELPRYQAPATFNPMEMAKNAESAREAAQEKLRREKERKQNILKAAFASDDEEESEWEEQDALFSGSDEE